MVCSAVIEAPVGVNRARWAINKGQNLTTHLYQSITRITDISGLLSRISCRNALQLLSPLRIYTILVLGKLMYLVHLQTR